MNHQQLSEESLSSPLLVASSPQLVALLRALSSQPAIAVDTEANSYYAYHERICLIQFSISGADAIVDPLADLDLEPLGDLFADPAVQKIFHAAEQDVAGLKRDFGFRFVNLFDTMQAARILGWPRVGLADVLRETFGVHTDKRYQRYNWGKRPLKPDALAYAQLDTHYLLPLRDLQAERLEKMGRAEEAVEAFARLAHTPPATSPFGPDAFWRVKGVRDLSAREQAVLWELYMWRDRVASELNRTPFRVMGNRTLVALARAQPRTLEKLSAVRGLTPALVRRYGEALLAAVARGKSRPAPQPPKRHQPDEAFLRRYRALRAWRRRVAGQRRVTADVILPNGVLRALAMDNPASMEDLERLEGLGPWRRKAYGPDILRVLHPPSDSQKSKGA